MIRFIPLNGINTWIHNLIILFNSMNILSIICFFSQKFITLLINLFQRYKNNLEFYRYLIESDSTGLPGVPEHKVYKQVGIYVEVRVLVFFCYNFVALFGFPWVSYELTILFSLFRIWTLLKRCRNQIQHMFY